MNCKSPPLPWIGARALDEHSVDPAPAAPPPRWSSLPPGPPKRSGERGELRGGLGLRRLDVHVDAVAAALLVLHGAFDDGVEREVAAHLDVAAGVHLGADLPDQDVP